MAHRILVVDDDRAIRSLAKESLTNWFNHCNEAPDGESAVRFAGEQKPDAIVLDMNMPGLSGFEVLQQLRSNTATQDIPVIFLTSRSGIEDKVKGMEMGAVDYITKPFDSDELRLRVQSALRSRDALQMAEARVATDKQTGLFNRFYLEHRAEADTAAASRWGKPVACYLAAVDDWAKLPLSEFSRNHFLRIAAEGIVASLRKEDVTCKWDDQTFAVLAFAADKSHAMELGSRIRQAISDAGYMCGLTAVQAVISVGVALSRVSTGRALLQKAEEALRDAQISDKGTIVFGAELVDLHTTAWTTNEAWTHPMS